MISDLLRRSRRFRCGEDGSSTVEFVLLFPPLFLIFLSGFDAGMMMMRNAMLERGVDLAVRELRLGDPSPPTYDEFKNLVCANTLGFLGRSVPPADEPDAVPPCQRDLQLELVRVDPEGTGPIAGEVRCIDKEEEIDPADLSAFYGDTGGNNEWMLVRACVNVNPSFDFVIQGAEHEFKSLGAILNSDGANGYFLVATSAYVNEPSRLDEG